MSTALERRRDVPPSTPFYTLPPRKTSAQIIREARNDINIRGMKPAQEANGGTGTSTSMLSSVSARTSVRTVNTSRPFTPRAKERTLFGKSAGVRGERPPSSFTLSPLHFDPSELGPRPSAGITLITITQTPNEEQEPKPRPVRLPSLGGVAVANRQQLFGHSRTHSLSDSLNAVPEEAEPEEGPLTSLTHTPTTIKNPTLTPNEDIFNSPGFQKLLQQNDLEVCDLDASSGSATAVRRHSLQNEESKDLGTRKFSGPQPSRFNSWKERTASMDAFPRSSSLDSCHGSSIVMKRPGVDRPWHHAVDNSPLYHSDSVEEESHKSSVKISDAPVPDEVYQSLYYEEKVAPMLDEITRAVNLGVSDPVLSELVDKLYTLLESSNLLGRNFRYRSAVLRTVFKMVDREHGQLLASLARIMLALRVSGTNLTSVCKLVFKVTRDDTNDHLFMSGTLLGLLLEAIGRVSPLDSAEAAVYGYGALKFLTMNSALCNRLLSRGVLELLTLHMMLIVNEVEEKGNVPQQTAYALVQLTATLRHVSSCERTFPKLLEAGAVTQVCRLLPAFKEDADVTANLARILSIISTQPECCECAASHPATLPACVSLLNTHCKHPAIVVRLAYALGNMMARDDDSRYELSKVPNFIETMLSLLTEYLKQDRESQAVPDPVSSTNASAEDVMVKVVRVLANVAVDPRVGPVLARSTTCHSLLISLLQHKSITESEELVLSCFATLNNLTFYSRRGPASSAHTELAQCLCEMVPMDHVEGLIEAVRVFGNLTHFKEVRDILTKNQVVEVLVEMLDCDSRELVYVCSGVLVNVMSDASRRNIFQQENGVLRMVEVLQYFGVGDWQLCTLACQVLWNYCASADNVHSALGSQECSRLVAILDALLEEGSHYLVEPEEETEDPEVELLIQLYEDFARVASKLLDRIENSNDSLHEVTDTN